MNKTVLKTIRMTPDLASTIEQSSQNYGLTFSEYVRYAVNTVDTDKLEQIKEFKGLINDV